MLVLFCVSILAGYLLFLLVLHLVPHLEKRDLLTQKSELIQEALHQKEMILRDSSERLSEQLNIMSEELDSLLTQKQDDLKLEEIEFTEREALLLLEARRLEQIEKAQNEKQKQIEEEQELFKIKKNEVSSSRIHLIHALEDRCHSSANELKHSISVNLTNEKQIELQKISKLLQEELQSSGSKIARRLLDRVHSRYSPRFIWPKTSNILEVKEKKLYPLILGDNNFFSELQEKTGVKIIPHHPSSDLLFVKVVGGFGISREAIRLTLEKLLSLEASHWTKAFSLFSSHNLRLEQEAVALGRKAVETLQIQGIHPELQKLVGALNWRTSYRQNQWYHTVEVAQFAGILAHELGVSPDDAKRVGLLHDIGKAIDYRIDGSHAVISGDYADRFGEKRYICDTVMSHHSDLVLETPLSFVLQAADTLSGARPGARVNLEEGYQVRLTAIHDVVKSFSGIQDLAVMNGGREVHIQVHNELISEQEVKSLTQAIARKIEQEVAYPGQIKILVTRTFESSAVA